MAGDASQCYTHEEGDNGCAIVRTAFKLIVLRSALRKYKRVLVLDDTVVVRKGCAGRLRSCAHGGVGGHRRGSSRSSPEEAKQSLEISCLRYGIPCNTEEAWFNSGVLVVSWPHLGLVETLPPWDSFERVLHWDQGYLNAMRLKYEVPLVDLGYAFNWVGSFHSTNRENAPFSAFDAFFVHGTTGLFSARIWSEVSTLSTCRGRGTLWVCELWLLFAFRYSAGTVGLFFFGAFCSVTVPRTPTRWACSVRRGEKSLSHLC